MRAILVQFMFVICIPMITIYSHLGVLMYYWFTWLNPHRLVWSVLNIEWGKVIAIFTFVFFLFSKESKKIPTNILNILVIIFYVWTGITTYFALYPDAAWIEFSSWTKILVMMILTTILINDEKRLHALIWIVCIGIGFFGVKGGIFTLISGGTSRVYGPPGSSIFNTNELARAFMMCIPLMYFLLVHSYHKIVRNAMFFVIVLTFIGLMGTTSRTAFLIMAVMAFFWWLRSPKKLKITLLGIVTLGVVYVALPSERIESLTEKYQSSAEYDTDGSFQSRIVVWNFVLEELSVRKPVTGGGFKAIVKEVKREPHSNYFQVLGEHGYVGLSIYLFLCIVAILQTNKIYNRAKQIKDLLWAKDLALMLQISLIGYVLGGITKNHAFFEFFYMQLAMIVILNQIVLQKTTEKAESVPITNYSFTRQF